jgi:capsular polysaccharide transport system permease protein
MKMLRPKMRRVNWILVVTLIVPTAVAAVYYGFIASDVYISESRFVVRNPDRASAPTGLGALLQTSGFSRSQDDTYSVHDYVMSRDALLELNDQLKIRDLFSRPSVDFVNRFSSWGFEKSFESFYIYYQKHVSVD